jgi:D-glycero-alpha-D-manno-heptose-7-phosphate kinase
LSKAERVGIRTGDIDQLDEILTENREMARRLDRRLFPSEIDALFEAGEKAGAIGSKPCGPGGGGCLLFLCGDGRRADVENALVDRGARMMSVSFAAGR